MTDQVADTDDSARASSPYSTGGGGVTFAHRVAATYLASLLMGSRRIETNELPIKLVSFQTGPMHPVDDLLLVSENGDVEVAVACRATPNFVQSDKTTVKLVGTLLAELAAHPTGYVVVAVAGTKNQWDQVATVCAIARTSASSSDFASAMETDGRWSRPVRDRYDHLRKMVEEALGTRAESVDIAHISWNLLARLRVAQFAVQMPREEEWAAVASALDEVALTPADGVSVRDRILVNAARYDAVGATVDMAMLRRELHQLIQSQHRNSTFRSIFDQLRAVAHGAVRRTIGVGADSIAPLELPLSTRRSDLAAHTRRIASSYETLIVTGPSGTGKSAMVLSTVADLALAEPNTFQSIVLNFRELPRTSLELEHILGAPLHIAFGSMSAAMRLLVIDSADAASERSAGLMRDLLLAATKAEVGVVVVAAEPAVDFVSDIVRSSRAPDPETWHVAPLDDEELKEVAARFPLLTRLLRNVPKTSLLRHLVVLDLISRTGLDLSGPVGEWDYLEMIWSNVMRTNGSASRGSPQAREDVLLSLARRALAGADIADSAALDPAAVDALRADHLLAPSSLYSRGPEFAHDEIRRYATAIYLVKSRRIALELVETDVPRWALSAVTLACKGLLLDPSAQVEQVFRDLVAAFDSIANTSGRRWGDVPVEAVLETPSAYACIKSEIANASSTLQLSDVLRVLEQRFSVDGSVDQTIGASVALYLVEREAPWAISEKAFTFLAEWFQSLIISQMPEGNRIRAELRARLTGFWEKYPFEPPKPSDASLVQRRRYRASGLDYHLTEEKFVELLALLGADIDSKIETILRTLAQHAPAFLAPAVDSPISARGIAEKSPELLADMIEAYYIDDYESEEWGGYSHDGGIRPHQGRWTGMGPPFDAYWYGGFWQLFMSAKLSTSARVLNRILNHAAKKRVERFADYSRGRQTWDSNVEQEQEQEQEQEPEALVMSLRADGHEGQYWGDGSVWNWYRGSSTGPYPCLSATQAMERWAERLLEVGTNGAVISSILLDGCENLAVPAMLFGLFTRHLEVEGDQLDRYLAEPSVWMLEFGRAASEYSGFRASSDGLAHPERRHWTPREVSVALMTQGNEERREELRSIGKALIANGEEDALDVNQVLAWATNLDDSSYKLKLEGDSVYLQVDLPQQVLESHADQMVAQERVNSALGLQNKYWVRQSGSEPLSTEEIVTDLSAARSFLEGATKDQYPNPVDVAGQVVRAAIERAAGGDMRALSQDGDFALHFALGIAGSFASVNRRDEGQYFDLGADRAIARSIPGLITPAFHLLRMEAGVNESDLRIAGSALATNSSFETRLFLARGCDLVWAAPCAEEDCHHLVAFDWLMDTARGAEVGQWDNDSQRQLPVTIVGDVCARLRELEAKSIDFASLAPAIRGLGAAAVAKVCVSLAAQSVLSQMADVQRRSIARHEKGGRSVDDRGTYALISARALLLGYSASGDPKAILDHLDAIQGRAGALMGALHGLAAAGAESVSLAHAARRLWPNLLTRAISFNDTKPSVYTERTWGPWAAAALLPNPAAWTNGLYNELSGDAIDWVSAEDIADQFDSWIGLGLGQSRCVDAIIRLLRQLPIDRQIAQGVSWVTRLCIQDSKVTVVRTSSLNSWLKEVRISMDTPSVLSAWQQLVDALVVAGNTELATFST